MSNLKQELTDLHTAYNNLQCNDVMGLLLEVVAVLDVERLNKLAKHTWENMILRQRALGARTFIMSVNEMTVLVDTFLDASKPRDERERAYAEAMRSVNELEKSYMESKIYEIPDARAAFVKLRHKAAMLGPAYYFIKEMEL